MNNILEIKNLNFSYDSDPLLKDISYEFTSGTTYGLLGPSGSGKSTILAFLSGLDALKEKEGAILFNGSSIKKDGLDKYRRDIVSIIFQGHNLIPYMSAIENLTVVCKTNKIKSDPIEFLEKTGISLKDMNRPVSKLSGGQQQRVAISRALIRNSKVIIADEPTGNLDAKKSQEIIDILKTVAKDLNMVVIIVTHDREVASSLDVQLVLSDYTLKSLDE